MKRLLLGAALFAPLAACAPTYVNEAQPGYAYGTPQTYVAPQAYGQPQVYQQQPQVYGQPQVYAPVPARGYVGGYRDGSYEAEREAYEYGRRDGANGR